ncbi:hypothetical protein DIPPA_33150 [Diplonema papillatum]|nr:hypothetical protein DIPPA_33150 [Diplonema papillatum]
MSGGGEQQHCSLNLACTAWVSMKVAVQCKSCFNADLEQARRELQVENEWRAEQEEKMTAALEEHKAAARAKARRHALTIQLKKLKAQLRSKQDERSQLRRRNDETSAAIGSLRANLAAAQKTLSQQKHPSAYYPIFPPAEPMEATLLQQARQERLDQLQKILPLPVCQHKKHDKPRGITIADPGTKDCQHLCIPSELTAESFQRIDRQKVSAALGLLCRLVNFLADLLDVSLPYQLNDNGDLSTVTVRKLGRAAQGAAPKNYFSDPAEAGAAGPDAAQKGRAPLGWLTSLVDVVSTFTEGPHDRPATLDFADEDSDLVQFPLHLPDAADIKHDNSHHAASFFRGLAAVNANIIALLNSHRLHVKSHDTVCMLAESLAAQRVEQPAKKYTFVLAECLASFLSKNTVLVVPLGFPVWRAYAGIRSLPGRIVYSGVYTGLLVTTSAGGASPKMAILYIRFRDKKVIEAKLSVGSPESLRSRSAGVKYKGSVTMRDFSIAPADPADAAGYVLMGAPVETAVTPHLRGQWTRAAAGESGTFVFKMQSVRRLALSPHSRRSDAPKDRPEETASPDTTTKVINADAFARTLTTHFEKKAQGMPRVASDGSDGWEVIDV